MLAQRFPEPEASGARSVKFVDSAGGLGNAVEVFMHSVVSFEMSNF